MKLLLRMRWKPSKLKDYFSGRKQLMCIDSQSFEELAITSKVPQGVHLWTPIVYYCQFSVLNSLGNIISCLHKPWIFLFFIFFQFFGASWIRHQFVLGPKTTTSEDSTFQWVDWLPLSSFICMDTCPVIHVTPLIGLTGAAVTRCRLKSALP